MKITSTINKPNVSDFEQNRKKIFSVPDETLSDLEQEDNNEQIKQIHQEDYIKLRKQINQSKKIENALSEEDKNNLMALLGFGVLEKNIDVMFNNIKYIITIQHFSDKIKEQFASDLISLKSSFIDKFKLVQTDEEQEKVSSSFLFAQKRLWISHAIKNITIAEPVNKSYSKEQIICTLGLNSFDELLETWGEEICEKLFTIYNDLNNNLKETIINQEKLVNNLKK